MTIYQSGMVNRKGRLGKKGLLTFHPAHKLTAWPSPSHKTSVENGVGYRFHVHLKKNKYDNNSMKSAASIYSDWNLETPYDSLERPSVVLLGAGATMAAIPSGDKNGLRSSCMDHFLDNLHVNSTIQNLKLHTTSTNLEDIYSEIVDRQKESNHFRKAKADLERQIRNYFSQMKIPDEPTIYDYLLLSLNHNDFIASFNWDPLLLQAYDRLSKKLGSLKNLPSIVFFAWERGNHLSKK